MRLRPATQEDSAFLFRLRNDPETRRQSLSVAEVSREEHVAWLERALADPSRRLFVAEDTGAGFASVGTGRLDIYGNAYGLFDVGATVAAGWGARLSLAVAPEWRGCGYARRIIAALLDEARRLGVRHCIADVKPVNVRSMSAFLAEGFAARDELESVTLVLNGEAWARRICPLCATGRAHHTNATGSIGGDEGRHPVWDLHVVEDAGGVGLAECLAADLWST